MNNREVIAVSLLFLLVTAFIMGAFVAGISQNRPCTPHIAQTGTPSDAPGLIPPASSIRC